ncbi:MAG TPA: methyltransferase domain-containing protein [Gammaproteobacteria bacterium]|jgi:2-polyprenyl-3-methyl-5-hydroxy-6-metoxy-1,4-benzoquinol methylase
MRVRDRYHRWLMRLSKTRSRQGLYEFVEAELRSVPRGARVLCIGAGGEVGALLDRCAGHGEFTVTSLDIDPARSPDVVADICSPHAISGEFDVVLVSEVLEHVPAPQQAVENIRAALRSGGRLILSTPFILPIHAPPHDYFRFTRHGLALLLRDFSAVSIAERNGYFEAIDVLWMRLLQEESRAARAAAMILVPMVYFLKRPFSLLLSRLVPAGGMTTGYVATAVK